MNDVGMSLAWSAVQITLILAPAAVLHAMASRRSATSGAWMATFGLSLSLIFSVLTLIPWPGHRDVAHHVKLPASASAHAAKHTNPAHAPGAAFHQETRGAPDIAPPGANLAGAFGRLLGVWTNLGQARVVPPPRFRQWGSVIVVFGIAGAGIGIVRLFIGLWAVRVWRRRGRIVSEPGAIHLLNEIRLAMGCFQRVEIREAPDLTAPATAGWLRPVILLPDDWRSWDDTDRRAVLAHELAHIQRWDYAAGLVAQLALALHFYHPLVRWMARRLQLQHELAADAASARFAGGRGMYLLTLSRLALTQDDRPHGWPARTFLPTRGTLIRRIAMLKDDAVTLDRPWSRTRKVAAVICLLTATVAAGMLRGPARAEENDKDPGSAKASVPATHHDTNAGSTPFDLRFVSDETEAMIAFRPAATFRRAGMPRITTLADFTGLDVSDLPKQLKIDLSAPGRLQLGLDDIDWVITSVHFSRGKSPDGQETHGFQLGRLTVRTTAQFDWLRFLREWRLEFSEARAKDRGYFKIVGHLQTLFGTSPCVYLPDDRTIVFDEEPAIQKMLRSDKPIVPAYLAGADSERFRHGILAVAINNQDGKFAKSYDLAQPDDAVVLSVFKGVERWMLGVDDADAIGFHATAVCKPDAGVEIGRSVESLLTLARTSLEHPEKAEMPIETADLALRMFKTFLTNIRVTHDDRSVDVRAGGFGTLAEFGSVVNALYSWQGEAAPSSRP